MARKDVEKYVINLLKELTGKPVDSERYKEFFSTLNDKQFKDWVDDVSDPDNMDTKLHIYVPYLDKNKLTVENILAVAKKYNINMFNKLIVTNPDGSEEILPNEALIIAMPIRRASQFISGQFKGAKHNKNTDAITHQATGDSAGGRLTLPEEDIMAALGYTEGLEELLQISGGDQGAYDAMVRSFVKFGSADKERVLAQSTGVGAKANLKVKLKVMYIDTNI